MIKQVILVPSYLKMSPGKVASQCCHVVYRPVGKRIILKVPSPAELNRCWRWASNFGLKRIQYIDRAPTTEGTDGYVTVLSFVGEEWLVDAVTGGLELY